MAYLNRFIFLEWVIAGLLLGVGFVYPLFWILGIVGAAYFLYLLSKPQTKKNLFLGAWSAWTIKYLFAISWFWSTYPIEWLPIALGKNQILLIFFYWLITSLSLGLGAVGLVGLCLVGKKYINQQKIFQLALLPLFWVLGEILGSYIFSIVTLGEGSVITSAFSFGYSGYLLMEHGLVYLFSGVAGVYGLSFLFAVVASALLYSAKIPSLKIKKLALVFVVILYLTSFVSLELPSKQVSKLYSVVTIDTNFPINYLRDRQSNSLVADELSLAMQEALSLEPDYIVLPEDMRFFNQANEVSLEKSFFQFQYKTPSAIIVDTSTVQVEGVKVLQAFIYDGINNSVYNPQKKYLAPQGEYMPYLPEVALRFLGYGAGVKSVSENVSFNTGSNKSQAKLPKEVPGVLFCFESVSPFSVRELMSERPDLPFVVHPISHAWFHEPVVLWHQFDSMLRVQAMWNDVYIVSAGNHVSGKMYTPNGEVKPPNPLIEGDWWTVRQTDIPY